MNTYWTVHTHGDPLGAIHTFLQTVWQQASLAGMLAPLNGDPKAAVRPRLIEDAALLEEINPFKPLMTENAARRVPEILDEHPTVRLGALLRPCEMRALTEMVKHDHLNLENLTTISADCLGTYPAEEYTWRMEHLDAHALPPHDPLSFARQGGIMAYHYRPACQMCISPEAQGADLNLHVIGLPVRERLLVEAGDDIAARFHLHDITAGPAEGAFVEQHQRVLAKVQQRYLHTLEHITAGLGDLLPSDVKAVVAMLENCGDCRKCMDACPICAVEYPQRDARGRLSEQQVMRWLLSCAGCGMCEQACSAHRPLGAIFRHIRAQLIEEFGYTPGRSSQESLPL